MSAQTRIRAVVIAATCSLAAVRAVALPAGRTPAQAADLGAFEAGNIISDALFYDSGTMSAAVVQSFLAQKGSACAATAGRTCLKNFRQPTVTRPADAYCTRTYTGASNESAAQIIVKVAGACGINPQVLLVMLQKEQGLVTATAGGSVAGYKSAMGYGCPDTAACNTKYYGFFNQVYSAAHQFRYYAKNPLGYAHRAGMVNNVRYNPKAACGTSPVYFQNQATVNLYNYTPYQPNAAALAAGYGTGDTCSAYGNRNFWNYFTDWFGPTTQRAPIGNLDAATSTSPGVISVRGWALDPDTTSPISVHVYVDGRATLSLAASGSRPDVGRVLGKGDNHGFTAAVKATYGTHQICVYAINTPAGTNPRIGCRNVVVSNQAPVGALDSVTAGRHSFSVRGWALDPDTTSSISVNVYVNGRYTLPLAAAGSRPDVGRVFGKGDKHGFIATLDAAPGTYQVCLYAINTPAGTNPLIRCSNVVVSNQAPVGALESVASGMDSFSVRGWALDPDTTSSISVHVYVDGRYALSLAAAGSRPDVGRVLGKGDNHGFSATLGAVPGTHQVCVYAINTPAGTNPRIGCSNVVISNQAPVGAIDSVTSGVHSFSVRGWALDPDTKSSISVHVYVDGRYTLSLAAAGSRPDVGRVLGKGDNHGFIATVKATPGTRRVCVYAINTPAGTNPVIGCRNVRVR